MAEQEVTIPIKADISGFSNAIKDMQSQSKKFGSAFSGALKSAVMDGKSLEDSLRGIALKLSSTALSSGLKPLETAVSGAFGQLTSGIGQSLLSGALGSVTPFAKGGVVASPTFFGSGGQMGVMGEAGAEAILPLSRGGDGRLGVKLEGASQSPNVVFNVTTPDAQSFAKSRSQVAAMLARTVGRGQRGL